MNALSWNGTIRRLSTASMVSGDIRTHSFGVRRQLLNIFADLGRLSSAIFGAVIQKSNFPPFFPSVSTCGQMAAHFFVSCSVSEYFNSIVGYTKEIGSHSYSLSNHWKKWMLKLSIRKRGRKKVIHNHYDYIFVSEILKIPSTHRSFNHIRSSIGTNYVARDDNAKDAPNWKIMKSKLSRSTHVSKTRKGSR